MEAQYIVDEHGNRQSVVLSVEDYERLLDAWEDQQDAEALAEDKARIDRGEAEFVPWEQVKDKIGSEYEPSSKE